MLSFILGLLKRFFENEFLQLVFSKVTGLFAAILTITWAVYEYRASKHETRVERTLSYIESWHANGVREHYSLIGEALSGEFVKLGQDTIKQTQVDPIFRGQVLRKISKRVLRDPNNKKAFDEILYHMNALGLCLHGNICDHETTALFFGETYKSFIDYFKDPLSDLTKEQPSYLVGLNEIKKTFRYNSKN